MYACGSIELINLLLDAGAHTDDLFTLTWERFSCTALASLTTLFNIGLAQLLLDINADINAADCWEGAVLTAAAMGNAEPVRTLFRAGVGIGSIIDLSERAPVAAAADRNTELVQILLKSGVIPFTTIRI